MVYKDKKVEVREGMGSYIMSYLPCKSQRVSPQEKAQILKSLEQKKSQEWDLAKQFHDKLAASGDYNVLGHGPIEDFHRGLEPVLGPSKKLLFEAMEKEHCESVDSDVSFVAGNTGVSTTSRIEWNFVVNPSQKKLEELHLTEWPKETSLEPKLRRVPRHIDDFEQDLAEVNIKLQRIGLPRMTLMELVALRIYSGPLGVKFNKMIRSYTAGHRAGQEWRLEEERKLCLGNKYSTTIHVIQSAISKLGKINPNQKGYSGVSGMLLQDRFWNNHPDLNSKGGVEGGFMSLSGSYDVGMFYANLVKGKLGVLLEVNMSTIDRGAELRWLAQYPHEDETLLPPLTYLHVEHIRLDKSGDDPIMVVEIRARISQSIQIQMPLLTELEMFSIRQFLKVDQKETSPIKNSKLLSRFGDEQRYFISGNPMESVSGLAHFLGVDDIKLQRAKMNGLEEIEREILAGREDEVIKNMKYVLYDIASESKFSNGIRDHGNSGKRLADFANHKIAKQYRLREEHVAALRIYTTSAFSYINNPLRMNNSGGDKGDTKSHPYPVTVSFIDDAIKLLRASTAKSFTSSSSSEEMKEDSILWRGIKNTSITEDFIDGGCGGTGEYSDDIST